MAETPLTRKPSPAEERSRLLAEIEASRRRLAGNLSEFGHAVNVRERIGDAIGRHPALWIGGALAAGLVLAKAVLPSRRRRLSAGDDHGAVTAAKRSLFLGLLGFAGKQILRLSEPTLKRLAQQEIERWSQNRSTFDSKK
jgi:hypothetical protein